MKNVKDILDNATWSNFLKEIEHKKLFLFGAGGGCKHFLDYICEDVHKKIIGIIDCNIEKQGRAVEGIKVMDYTSLLEEHPEDVVVCVTSTYMNEILQQLMRDGFDNVFFWAMFNQNVSMWLKAIEDKNMPYISELESILEDDHSRRTLESIVHNRATQRKVWLEINDHSGYFNTGVFNLNCKDVVVDGGAFIGDTIEEIEGITADAKIYAFEPDPDNYRIMKERYGDNERIKMFQAGLWSSTKRLSFSGNSGLASSICEDGNTSINVVSLDDTISSRVDLIKMDIEGAELEALKGAQKIITKYTPKLAICIYHRQDDLWKIPLYIKKLVPKYHIYIRHQSDYSYDTVMYAYV